MENMPTPTPTPNKSTFKDYAPPEIIEKIELNIPRKAKLGYSVVHGRGVFADRDISQGEIIERCPFVVLGYRMRYHSDPVLLAYLYTHVCPCDECKKHGGNFLLILGYGQIYNHQDNHNAEFKYDFKHQIVDVFALRSISKDEEIFVNYGESYFRNREKKTL